MYKCKICGKKYTELTALYNHIENKHKDMIPKDMSVQQFYYYMKTGRTNGNCVMCKKPTSWNHNTGKYNRFCGDEKCKEEYVKIMKGRMVAKYGKTHLLNDPNKQREMLANRSISGVYKWSDGKHETTYTGSYELDFLRTLDDFFDWDPEDISMPSPHTYTYKYEGEDKFYIPDVFIHSLDLEIEIKDGGDNPNNHHKIQEVDKEKERLKDEVLCSQKAFHYVKITNKNYENFFRFLKEIKKAFEKFEDETKIPRIFKIEDIKGTNVKPVKESCDIVEDYCEEKFEGFQKDAEKLIKKYDKFSNTKYNDADMFLSLQYNLAKNSPKELQRLLSKLIKYAKCDDDFRYVEKLVGDSETHYHYLLDKHPNLKDEYELYYDWIKKGGMEKEIKDRKKDLKKSKKKIQEALDEIDFVEEKFEPDKFLVWFDKPIKKLRDDKIRLFHAAPAWDCYKGINFTNSTAVVWKEGDTIVPDSVNMGVTYHSNIRKSIYCWDNINYGKHWGLMWTMYLLYDVDNLLYKDKRKIKASLNPMNTSFRIPVFKSKDMSVDDFVDYIISKKPCYYIYEFEVPTSYLEIGGAGNIKEYTISEPITVLKRHKIFVTKEDIFNYCIILDIEDNDPNEYQTKMLDSFEWITSYARSGLLGIIANGKKDFHRDAILKLIASGKIKNNDELEAYSKIINKNLKKQNRRGLNPDAYDAEELLKECVEEFELLEEKFEPDKFLVWFDKPIQKLKGGKINVYHGSSVKMNDTVKPISPNVGATKHSDPRWSTYVWDNREDAIAWASAWAVKDVVGARNLCYVGHNNKGKTMIAKPENMSNKEFMLYLIENVKTFYVYEFEIDINDLEIGSCPTIREYTVSKPMEITRTFEYKLNKEIFRRCFEIVSLEELQEFERTMFDSKLKMPKHRGMILNNILSTCKDPYRNIIRTEVENGNVQPGDDISFLKYSINRHFKNDSYGFLESYIIDTMEESSISIPQMNYYLQNQYEEEMKRYLNTYKKYYNLMLKEQPSAVKHINEDIKKCLIVIDGMASKGVENNLVQFAKDDLGEIVKAAKHGKPVKVYETFGDYIEERAGKLDRALIWLDKPKEKRKGGNITLYHGSLDFDKFEKADAFAEYGYKSWKKGDVIEPNAIVPGATALSKPRYGIYFWDNKEYAYEWAVNRAIGFIVGRENRTYKLSHGKAVLIRKENGMSDDDAIKNIIKIAKQKGLDNLKIYESEVSIHDLEITGLSTVKEYTVSKPVTITKVDNVKLTPELLKKHCDFIEHDEFDDYRKNAFKGDIKIERNHSIPMLLALLYMEPDRDAYRGMLLDKLVSSYEDPKEELRKHGGKYRRMLNKSVKQKSSTLVENMVDDMVNIDDDVNDINCISVQDGNVSISNEIIECKLVYENSNARQLFSLTDTNSKLIINDELVIQRDKVGLHCSIKPLYESFEYENSIEFQVTLNGNEELNITDEKISEGVNISSLFKFNDNDYKFIKEACVKIFGVQPKEIKTK
jgi:hypothetical protein